MLHFAPLGRQAHLLPTQLPEQQSAGVVHATSLLAQQVGAKLPTIVPQWPLQHPPPEGHALPLPRQHLPAALHVPLQHSTFSPQGNESAVQHLPDTHSVVPQHWL